MRHFFLLSFLGLATTLFAQLDSLNSYYTKGLEALKMRDTISYHHYFDLANQIRPNHPTLLYHLANASLLNGDQKSTLDALTNLVRNNVNLDLDQEAYVQFKEMDGFSLLAEIKTELNMKIHKVEEKFKVDISDHIESIAYNKKDKSYYFGAVNARSLWHVNSKGQKEVLLSYKNNEAIFAVMGIVIDELNQTLWACTAALPQIESYTDSLEGHSSIFKMNLESGKVEKMWKFKDGNYFGDIKLKDGIPYISDGRDNNIYYLNGNEFLKLLPEDNGFINLQGIAFDDNYIFASDYIRGLFRIDINKDYEISKMNVFGEYPERGVDGVYCHNGSMYLTQNGTSPMRVFKLEYNKEKPLLSVLIQNSPLLSEPTQGYIIGNKFQFIANSSWGNYSEENSYQANEKGVLVLGN